MMRCFTCGGRGACTTCKGSGKLPDPVATNLVEAHVVIGRPLDVGIARVVQLLVANGFATMDLGDGYSKNPASIDNPDGDPDAETEPHVYMMVEPSVMVFEAHRLMNLLATFRADRPEGVTIEVNYSPIDGVAILALRGFDDAMLEQ